jgi:hypothetical protein
VNVIENPEVEGVQRTDSRELTAEVRSEFGYYRKTSEGRHGEQDQAAECKEAEVFFAQAQPLQDLWTSTGLFAQVRPVPSVFQDVGAAGRDPRSFEVVLVEKQFSVVGYQLPVRSRSTAETES